MLAFRLTILVLGLLALSSCAYTPGGTGFPWEINLSGYKCKNDSSQSLEGVDWNQAKVLDIRIRQGQFSPTYLGLYMEQPYILIIENADDVDHTFRAFDFFRAIAVAGVSVDGADFRETNCMAGVTISPRTKTAMRFVAVRDGTYEFEDDSIVNSLAMVGSGGGFITIEPRRGIIENPIKHTRLFDYKPIVIKTEPSKENGPALIPNSLPRGLSKNPKKNREDQPSSATDYPEPQQQIDQVPAQPVAISPLIETLPSKGVLASPSQSPMAYQELETPVVPKVKPRKEIVNKQKAETEEAPLATETKKDLTQQDVPEAMPRDYQLFEGPPADVYSDPPDGGKIRTNSGDADGDGGDDKLDQSS